jgi:hypothetical protein
MNSAEAVFPDLTHARAEYEAGRLDLQGLCEVGEAYAAALASEIQAIPDAEPADLEALAVACYLRRARLERLGLRPGESPEACLTRLGAGLASAHERRQLEARARELLARLEPPAPAPAVTLRPL